jgi:hypothetical protein
VIGSCCVLIASRPATVGSAARRSRTRRPEIGIDEFDLQRRLWVRLIGRIDRATRREFERARRKLAIDCKLAVERPLHRHRQASRSLVYGDEALEADEIDEVNGDLEFGTVDMTAAISTGIGVPTAGSSGAATGFWRDEPFQQIVRGASGQIVVKATRAALTPNLSARDFQGVLYIGESQLALQITSAIIAGGRVAGELIFLRESAGLIARLRLSLAGADVAELLAGNDALTGQVALEITAEGIGMSPSALIGTLEGTARSR